MTTDVAIVGGGPAGTAAALTLCRYAARGAVVLERGDYSEPRVGEALGPGARPLLDYLGIERMIEAAGHRRAHALAAAWGGGEVLTLDFLLTGRGEGWHLDRNRFDRSLADAAREAGAVVLTRARVAAARRVGNRWRIQAVDVDGQEQEIDVGFLIDAGGRGAAIARGLGAAPDAVDRLAGVVGLIAFDPPRSDEGTTFVEAVPEGWWYSAPLPGARLVVAFMSDADLIRELGAQTLVGWLRLLARAPHTRLRVVGGRRPDRLLVRRAASQVLRPAGGDGWLACGDAAASHDPLSATGIGYALASGAHAARAAEAALRGDLSPHAEYTRAVGDQFAQYLDTRRHIYGLERRWPGEPFWSRRNGPDAGGRPERGASVVA